jgi:hypothetical protein
MSAPKGTKFILREASAYGTNYTTVSTGPMILAYGGGTLRISGYVRNIRGSFAIKPRYRRFAVRAENPEDEAWTEGTAVTANGQFSEDFSLASLGAYFWIQPAIGGAITTGNGGDGLVGWQAWIKGNGMLIAKQTVVLNPDINTSQTAYIPLGVPFPALGLGGVMAAVAARGISGSPTINFVGRTFEGDVSLPSTWGANLLGTDKTLSTTNEDYNTGDLTYAPTDTGWAQIGLKVPMVNAYGTLDILIAAKYS